MTGVWSVNHFYSITLLHAMPRGGTVLFRTPHWSGGRQA